MPQIAIVQPQQDPSCLIIEDSHFDHKMMTRVIGLSYSRMRVEIVTSLKDARAALAREGFSIILLDNNLPDGYGANFALELAGSPQVSHIPVIMVSDWPTPFMWDKAAKAGVLNVVNKSEFTVAFFRRILSKTLRRRVRARAV